MEPDTVPAWVWLIPVASLIGFLVLWLAIFHAIAMLGGWKRLARTYPPMGLSSGGETLRFRSMQLRRGAGYNNAVSFVVGPASLRLQMPFVFRAGHEPIEVPWQDISAQAFRAWFVDGIELHFAREPEVPVRVRRPLAESIARASGGRLALPPKAR